MNIQQAILSPSVALVRSAAQNALLPALPALNNHLLEFDAAEIRMLDLHRGRLVYFAAAFS